MQGGVGHRQAWRREGDPRWYRGRGRRSRVRGVEVDEVRTRTGIDVEYVARGSSGLFARPGEHYGEVWYSVGGRQAMSRSTTEPIVLETVYQLAGITPPTNGAGPSYSGYPLAVRSAGAMIIFYGVWPATVIVLWLLTRRPRRMLKPLITTAS